MSPPSLILTARQITTDRAFHFSISSCAAPRVPTLTLTGFAGDIHLGSLAYKFALASFRPRTGAYGGIRELFQDPRTLTAFVEKV